jgi:TP901 family phage tail tape measure protein
MSDHALQLRVLFRGMDQLTGPLKQVTAQVKQTRTQLRELEQTQKQVSGYRTLQNQLTGTGTALDQARQRARALQQELIATERPTKAMRTAYTAAVREVRSLTTAQRNQTQQLTGLRQQLNASGISTSNLSTHERRLADNISQVNARLRTQQTELDRLTSKQQNLQRLREQHGRDMMRVGMIGGAGYAGVAAGRRGLSGMWGLISPGNDFNFAMSEVQALSRLDRNSAALAALRGQARSLGASTMYTATDVAGGQAFLAMAGFTPDSIQAAMPGLLSMAFAGNTDLARTADIASNILGGFDIDPSQMPRVADVLTKGFTTANTNLEMLGQTMEYVGPVARAAGMSLEESVAMAGLLGNAGIQANKAGTTLRAMLLRLSSPVTGAKAALRELRIEVTDLSGNVRSLPTLLSEVAEATAGLGTGEQLQYLKRIFGEEPAAGMAQLIRDSGAGRLREYLAIVQDNAGAAQQTANIRADNEVGDVEQLRSAWADVGITINDAVSPSIRSLTQQLTSMVRGIGAWLAEHPTLTKWLFLSIAALLALITAVGGLMIAVAGVLAPLMLTRFMLGMLGIQGLGFMKILGGLATAIRVVGVALRFLLIAGGPIVWLIRLIAFLAFLVYRNWEPIKAFFLDIWSRIQTAFAGGLRGIGGLLMDWSPLGWLYKAFSGVLRWFGIELPDTFSGFGAMIIDGLWRGLTNQFPRLRDWMLSLGDMMPGWLKGALGIQSPSRVFAAIGVDTMAGLAQGLENSGDTPLSRLRVLSGRIQDAGRGIMLGLATGAASGVAAASPGGLPTASSAPAYYEIHIHAAPGMNEERLALLVREQIEAHERMKAVRARSSLRDQD